MILQKVEGDDGKMWYYVQTTPGFSILSPEQEKWNDLSVSYRFQQCQNDYVN